MRKGTYKNTEKRGGNVTIYIVAAKNLKNTDLTPLALESDPFVRVTIPRHCSDPDFDSSPSKCVGHGLVYTNEMVRTSSTVANSVNPKWPGIGDPLYFGFHESGQPIFLEVFDEDTGLEWGDDNLLETTDDSGNIQWDGKVTEYIFDCSAVDQRSQVREANTFTKRGPNCSEAVWVPLIQNAPPKYCDSDEAICLHIRMDITPLDVSIDKILINPERKDLWSAVVQDPPSTTNNDHLGRPYADAPSKILNYNPPLITGDFGPAKGWNAFANV